MSRTLDAPARPAAPRVRPERLLAAELAAVVAVGGVAIAFLGVDPRAPAKPNGAPSTPVIFGDPHLAKGAHGDETRTAPLPVFRDPTVRKGAGGR